MKLELKHLAPYFPYKLKILGLNNQNKLRPLSLSSVRIASDLIYDRINENKPILRPLSDFNTRTYLLDCQNLDGICIEEDLSLHSKGFGIELREYMNIYDFLFKNHFDVFGLIEKGLAIDINTLNKKNE